MDVSLLALKVTLTPLVIAAVTLAARRWGHGAAGLLVGLPLTSGPVSVFLAVEQGPAFAQAAAAGTIGGIMAVAVYILAYAHLAARASWPWCVAAGLAGFLAMAPVLATQNPALVPVAVLCPAFLVGTYLLLPRPRRTVARGAPPRWDLPLRMAAATTMTLVLTAAADVLGPVWTGVFTPFPVFTVVLGAFTHRQHGAAAVNVLLNRLVLGLFSFVAFFLVVGLALPVHAPAWTYLLAAATSLSINAVAWAVAQGPLSRPRARSAAS